MQTADLRRLAEVQKEIVVATWKLDGQDVAARQSEDLATVAEAQGELRGTAQMLASRMQRPAPSVDRDETAMPGSEALGLAVAAMGLAEKALRAQQTAAAIPPEMRALNQLLRAQNEMGRTQVSQTPRQGGRGNGPSATEDLSALFDDALRRDQQTNYEHRRSAAADDEPPESDVERRLGELAARQQGRRRAAAPAGRAAPGADRG